MCLTSCVLLLHYSRCCCCLLLFSFVFSGVAQRVRQRAGRGVGVVHSPADQPHLAHQAGPPVAPGRRAAAVHQGGCHNRQSRLLPSAVCMYHAKSVLLASFKVCCSGDETPPSPLSSVLDNVVVKMDVESNDSLPHLTWLAGWLVGSWPVAPYLFGHSYFFVSAFVPCLVLPCLALP